MSTQHTPHPVLSSKQWTRKGLRIYLADFVTDSEYDAVATFASREDAISAVLVHNSHERLLEAAKKMANFLDTWEDTLAGVQMSQDIFDTDSGLSEALAAIAATEGGAE